MKSLRTSDYIELDDKGNSTQPGKDRVTEVLYYRNSNIERYKAQLKEYNYDEYVLTNADDMCIRHGIIMFKTFDDAIEFIDNLGFDDILINVVSLVQRIKLYDYKLHQRFISDYSTPKNADRPIIIPSESFNHADFIFNADIYNGADRIGFRLTDNELVIGDEFKLNMQYTSHRDIKAY